MIGRTNTGGGSSLNFSVKAYATEELLMTSKPKENTIGIVTTTDITGYIFSAAEPSGSAEGMVWIDIGTSSPVAFSATKKNPVMVYPLSAKQYSGSAWLAVTAKSYQNGIWVEWFDYLFNNGAMTDVTGDWKVTGATADVTYSIGETLKLNCPAPSGITNYITNMLHETPVYRGDNTTLNIHFVSVKAANGNDSNPAFTVTDGKNGAFTVNYKNLDETDWTLQIDISTISSFILKFSSHPWQSLASYCEMEVDRIWLS